MSVGQWIVCFQRADNSVCSQPSVTDFVCFSPSVLACLWDVTDKDIDRFTQSILKNWLTADKDHVMLSDHILAARKCCKLPYLVGCASVLYGLPIAVSLS